MNAAHHLKYSLWVGQAQTGRKHDANAVIKTGVEAAIALFNNGVPHEDPLLILVDFGYEKFRSIPAVAIGHQKPQSGPLTESPKEWNRIIDTNGPQQRRPTPISRRVSAICRRSHSIPED